MLTEHSGQTINKISQHVRHSGCRRCNMLFIDGQEHTLRATIDHHRFNPSLGIVLVVHTCLCGMVTPQEPPYSTIKSISAGFCPQQSWRANPSARLPVTRIPRRSSWKPHPVSMVRISSTLRLTLLSLRRIMAQDGKAISKDRHAQHCNRKWSTMYVTITLSNKGKGTFTAPSEQHYLNIYEHTHL